MEKLTTAQVQLRLTNSQSQGRKHTSKPGEEPHRAHPHSGTAYLSFLCVFLMDSKYTELIRTFASSVSLRPSAFSGHRPHTSSYCKHTSALKTLHCNTVTILFFLSNVLTSFAGADGKPCRPVRDTLTAPAGHPEIILAERFQI